MKATIQKRLPGLIGLAALCLLTNAEAATYTVTTFSDVINAGDGVLSLREAVIAANASVGPHTILLSAGTYNLTIDGPSEDLAATGDLDITNDVTITGAGAGSTTIAHSSAAG